MFLNRFVAFALFIAGALTASAQSDDVAMVDSLMSENNVALSDSLSAAETDSLIGRFMARYEVDSVIMAWYSSPKVTINDFVPDSLAQASDVIGGVADSVYVARLQAMMSPIPMVFNKQVRQFIEFYVVRRRALVQKMLGLSEYYFPIFEQTLEAHGMPLELRFLPVIESALNPYAYSRAGASGLWQFMYYTGKRYGLEITSYVDERRDPVRASEAAAIFLHELYVMYGDWHLAIAAYNCGPGNVNRAIARSGGGKKTFWEIYYHLPRETRGYVPAFIAASYAMTYAQEHAIYPTQVDRPQLSDTVSVWQPLHFNQVSSVLGVSTDVIRQMNPQYKYDVVPAHDGKAYSLVLPVQSTFSFAAFEDSIYARDRVKYFPDNKIVPISEKGGRGVVYSGATPAGMAKLVYTVKSGDVPGSIASRFGVRVNDLIYWNNIRRNMIRVGQKLVIFVPKGKADKFARMAKVVK